MFYFLATIFFLFIFSAASVQAEPVYLKCRLYSAKGFLTPKDGVLTKELVYDVTLNEANQQVSYSLLSSGYTEKTTGAFSADKVVFVSHLPYLDLHFTINRMDLSFRRNEDKGNCSLVETPKNRKF